MQDACFQIEPRRIDSSIFAYEKLIHSFSVYKRKFDNLLYYEEMSNRHTCFFSLIVLCLCSVRCEEFYVEQGKIALMPCASVSSGVIEWKYNSQLVVREDAKTGAAHKGTVPMAQRARIIGGDLRVRNVERTDAGVYTCIAGNASPTEHRLYVLSASSRPASPVLQGTKVELQCQIFGGSKLKSTWSWPNGTQAKTSEGGLFTLQSVDVGSSGKWTCQIKPDSIIHLSIVVLGLNSNSTLTVTPGESVVLPCFPTQSLSNGPVYSLRLLDGGWERISPGHARLLTLEKSGGQLRWSSTGVQGEGLLFERENLATNLNVTLRKVTVQHSGKYQCFLKFQDRGTVTAQVLLEVKGQPGQTGNGAGSNGVQVHSRDGFLGLSLWVWLAIGAGCLVLFILIGITVYLTRRNKRMKRRARKLRSMRQPLTARDYCQCNRGTAGRPNGRRRDEPPAKECQR